MKREEAKQFIPIIEAWAERKVVQKLGYDGEWRDFDADEIVWVDELSRYRIKAEPKLRPWRFEEVPPLALIRDMGFKDGWSVILGARRDGEYAGIWTHGRSGAAFRRSFDHAMNECVHSTDGGKTWLPCGVLE